MVLLSDLDTSSFPKNNSKICIALHSYFLNINFIIYEIMAKRVTIMLDNDLVKKLHEIQAKQIKISTSSVSFSGVINELIRDNLKK